MTDEKKVEALQKEIEALKIERDDLAEGLKKLQSAVAVKDKVIIDVTRRVEAIFLRCNALGGSLTGMGQGMSDLRTEVTNANNALKMQGQKPRRRGPT